MTPSIKLAVIGVLIYVAIIFSLKLMAAMLAHLKGSVGFDTSRHSVFILSLLIWVLAFSIAYSISPPFGKK
jgi:hypothetical protein